MWDLMIRSGNGCRLRREFFQRQTRVSRGKSRRDVLLKSRDVEKDRRLKTNSARRAFLV